VWVIRVKRHIAVNNYRYCDPELPAEFRPQLADSQPPAMLDR